MLKFLLSVTIIVAFPLKSISLEDSARFVANENEFHTLKSCLSSKENYFSKLTCIGVVASPCRETQDGATTIGASACYGREFMIWNSLLEEASSKFYSAAKNEEQIYLKDTQIIWNNFLIQSCRWPYITFPQGTIARQLSAECMMRQTALRSLDLIEAAAYLRER